MMNYLFRPTPTVPAERGPFASQAVISGWTSATMRGIPAGRRSSLAVSRMRRVDTRMQPWIKESGTMGSFMPAGMGGLGDDAGSGIDWSSAGDISPIIPDVNVPDLVPPDLGSPSFMPSSPVAIGIDQPPAPTLPDDFFGGAWGSPNIPAYRPQPVAPPAGAGPIGMGIPGTQPLSRPAWGSAPSIASQVPSWLNTILNTAKTFVNPQPLRPAAYTQMPGYGGMTRTVSPASAISSWFSAKTLPLSQQLGSNGMVLGVAVVTLLILGGGHAATSSRGRR